MLVGYARVSTSDQSLALQQDALTTAGCEKIFTDVVSGATSARPGLDAALAYLRAGDTLVVWKLDRLGRSLRHLITVVTDLHANHKGLRSLQEAMDTTTPGGKLIFHVFGALAEFERELIRERTQAGLSAARARGRSGGRPRVMTAQTLRTAQQLLADPDQTIHQVCQVLHVSRSTLYRYLQPASATPERAGDHAGHLSHS